VGNGDLVINFSKIDFKDHLLIEWSFLWNLSKKHLIKPEKIIVSVDFLLFLMNSIVVNPLKYLINENDSLYCS
jgi:hypothetical protein